MKTIEVPPCYISEKSRIKKSRFKSILEKAIIVFSLLGMVTLFYTQFTILVINPLEGFSDNPKTMLITRMENTRFLDTPEAICRRTDGGLSATCSKAISSRINNGGKVYANFPYADWLYKISSN